MIAGKLLTRTTAHAIRVRVADNFVKRLCGLMLRGPMDADEALLLLRCSSIHTAWMRYPIDLLYLNADGEVLRSSPQLRPWRIGIAPAGTVHVLEMPAGSIERLGLAQGSRLEHPALVEGLAT
ncbi:DUF192 domain-containing protein [Solimonas aquatica]|uniref:DUF192 domain-containing protein n=1 Tax=Solimonas aquatica TaxID=489703 RepID=UPI000B8039CA|nr:DUF192 domain-containing protein [Solimonas aquatica]